MKKKQFHILLLLMTMSFFANADIIHHEFGNDLSFSMNEMTQLDLDNDGSMDVTINAIEGKLDIMPIYQKSCFVAYEGFDNNIGGIRMRVLEEDNLVKVVGLGLYFEEDDDLPLYDDDDGAFYEWADGEAKYIGFAFFLGQRPGWMKISVDAVSQKLYIHAYAFNSVYSSEILVGQTVSAPVDVEETVLLTTLKTFPNPVTDLLQVEFSTEKADQVTFRLHDLNGKVIFVEQRNVQPGIITESFNLNSTPSGMYQLTVQLGMDFICKKILINI